MPPVLDPVRANARPLRYAAIAMILAGALLAGQAYARVESRQEIEETDRWTEEASFEYVVPVTRNSTHIPIGTRLPMGEPAYYRTVSESVLVDFSWEGAGLRDARGVVYGELVIRARAESPTGRTYWEVVTPLDEQLGSEEGLHLSGVVLLDDLLGEVLQVNRELPLADGRINFTIEAAVTYALAHDGRQDAGRSLFALPMGVQDPRITLPPPDEATWSRPHVQTAVAVTPVPSGWGGVWASPLPLALAGFGIAGLAGLAWVARAHVAGDRDAAFARALQRHREWITPVAGSFDASALAPARLHVESLDALVPVAADARTRILLDPATRTFFVALPHVTYVHDGHCPYSR